MSDLKMIKSILKEYGIDWAVNRTLYVFKLKLLRRISFTEGFFEKKTKYPQRLDIFQVDVESLKKFLRNELSDEDRTALLKTADKACEGIITAFSSVELDYGYPIDWQFNPLTKKRCDEYEKWYKIPDFDKERGDIKVIWEASRFPHFITLARAYLLTEDIRYYRAFSEQLRNWLETNTYSRGANYKCGQECSIRMVNALLAFSVFKKCGIADDLDTSCMKDLVDRCYRKVLSNFFYAYKCIKNNHTISELMGLIVGAWCCNDQKLLKEAYGLLDEVVEEQFMDDGGYRQFSFNYQRLALQDLEIVLSISSRVGISLNKNSYNKIYKSAMLMYQCQDENGDMPNYGSNDGALIFPFTSCGYRNFRPVINSVAALTSGMQLYDIGKHLEELLWLVGEKTISEYSINKIERISSQFTDAGLFTIRGEHSWAMIVSNSYTSRPDHMDQLHIDLWISNINVLCDAGTYSYSNDEGKEFVKNNSHNTVVVKGKPQMNTKGPFMIYDWSRRKLGACDNTSFSGMFISANKYTHLRKVKKANLSYEIRDKVNNDYKVLFHTPCDVILKNGQAIITKDGRFLCLIKSTGILQLEKSKRSLFYLKKEDINCISISGHENTKTIIEIIKENNKNG